MKTLARDDCRSEIVRRLRQIGPSSTRHWGRMSAHQMICHLIDSHWMMSGDKAVSDASSRLTRTMVKWLALYVPLRWRPGYTTRPEIDQELSGTSPKAFAEDLATLVALVEATPTAPNVDHPPHPVFGRMSHAAWLRWAYLHLDHHLRQFGA